MTREAFWKLIGKIKKSALAEGDEEGAVEPLQAALEKLGEDELFEFQEHLAQTLYALDGKKYADEAGESGGSGDGFLYARCFVVAKGEKHYESVLANPKKMSKSIDDWCESLLYAAPQAWASITGNEPEDWEFESSVSYESFSNEKLWK